MNFVASSWSLTKRFLVAACVLGCLQLGAVSVAQAQGLASAKAIVGAKVTFTATADGSPAPTFQWRKNGSPIPGATSATFVISAVGLADAGTYQAVATNAAGYAVSHDAVLEVTPAPAPSGKPTITVQPTPLLARTAGAEAELSVIATGLPAPTYQWYKGGAPIAGATGSTFSIAAVSLGDAGTYHVVVTNSAGTATSETSVIEVTPPPAPLIDPPVILEEPVALTRLVGESVEFTVTAIGTPAPTYQWRKNGAPIAGATGASYNLGAASLSHAGVYSVAVTNAAGTVISANAKLTVTDPVVPPPPPPPPPAPGEPQGTAPVFSLHPASLMRSVGATASFSVTVTGVPTPTLQWQKDGLDLPGATGSTLTLESVSGADTAVYSVVATNAHGSTMSNGASLVVSSSPRFTVQPLSESVPIGSLVRLSALATGSPAPTYQWQKNGVSIPGATTPELVIENAGAADAAVYGVIATNAVGAAASAKAFVTVGTHSAGNVYAPIITAQPFSQITVAKTNITFRVAATGVPAPTYQWRKNGAEIPGATSSVLTLMNVSAEDAGAYSVVARNTYGSATSKAAELTVNPLPGSGPVAGVDETDNGGQPIDPTQSRIVNLSVRSTAGTGDDSLIVGFVVSDGTQKPILVRGIGPTLAAFGVGGVLEDPQVALYSGTTLRSSNDEWSTSASAGQIQTVGASVGAFALHAGSGDAALISSLTAGAYTAQVSGKVGANRGVALIELYDGASKLGGRFINVSTRARVGSGDDVPNIGFVIEGTQPKRVLIRAAGPTLGAFGVPGVIEDPQLELFEGPSRLRHNDNWDGATTLTQAFSQVGAFAFSDPLSKDAALLVTLEPGSYTAVVSGVGGSTGTVLVEVYEVP